MKKAEEDWLIHRLHKILEAVVEKDNEITNILLRFEGKKIRQVDLERNLSRFD